MLAYLVLMLMAIPLPAQAVIPPDFIFNIGGQIAQYFSIFILSISVVGGAVIHFFKDRLVGVKHKTVWLMIGITLIVGLALVSAYLYAGYRQQLEYQNWLKESEQYSKMDTNASSLLSMGDTVSSNDTHVSDLAVSNEEFNQHITSDSDDYIVIDAREDLEYANGYFPGSTHIRFADLTAGRWQELPTDKLIYVICWSGIRGKEVAEFLKTKQLNAFYLADGANGWVNFGGGWIGSIKFSEQYGAEQYHLVFTTDQVKAKVAAGVLLVDSRPPEQFNQSHIAGSVNIPIMYTATDQLAAAFAQVPTDSSIITICDDYVNCFDAKITGVELVNRGNQFLGRYNKPWEYEQ